MRIRELREAAGLSQMDLARQMRVSGPSVIQWETGRTLPTADKLPRLADLLGCSIDALYGRTEPPAASITSTQKGGDHEQNQRAAGGSWHEPD